MPENFKLIIEYDGTRYCGWQCQPNQRSIQQEIETALTRMTRATITLIGSGRTDAGVHALGQVANFLCETTITPQAFQKGLNSILPDDIVIRACDRVTQAFHARFDAKSKTYHYTIHNAPLPAAIGRQYEWWIRTPLDVNAMTAAAAHLVGRKDFKAFEGTGSPRAHTIRHITQADVVRTCNGRIVIEVTADGFLRHMVRNIAGTLAAVGKGIHAAADIPSLLASRDRGQVPATAPAQGLSLIQVRYS